MDGPFLDKLLASVEQRIHIDHEYSRTLLEHIDQGIQQFAIPFPANEQYAEEHLRSVDSYHLFTAHYLIRHNEDASLSFLDRLHGPKDQAERYLRHLRLNQEVVEVLRTSPLGFSLLGEVKYYIETKRNSTTLDPWCIRQRPLLVAVGVPLAPIKFWELREYQDRRRLLRTS